ncbi:hypothetical protein LY76DRAFT_605227 [Colletotrichum caudatum]|nr:hypothetical protein LY76DRAFT_605227 [Colletotrichum caudatum]
MKAVSVVFFASVAAAAVIDSGLAASRDNSARHLASATSNFAFFERDDDDATFEDFYLKERDEIDDLVARNVETIRALRESVPLQARDDAAANDAKKNSGKADGKATDAKKNTGKADGKANDAKKNTGKADGKATDGNNNGTSADDGKSKKKNDGTKGKEGGDGGKKDNPSSGAGAAAAGAA